MRAPALPALPLRDIHLPPPVSWWPPAPGWWAAGGIVAAAAVTWFVLRWRRRRPASLRQRALDELQTLERKRAGADPCTAVRDLSVLLRRIGLSYYPREKVAGLVGDAWLDFLDDILGDRRFSEGPGRALLDAPYRPPAPMDVEALHALCADWIRALPRRPRAEVFPHCRRERSTQPASRTATEATLPNGRK